MAQPSEQQLIAALDIGSSKVSALIATLSEDGRVSVLGTGQRESRGVKRGYITDMALPSSNATLTNTAPASSAPRLRTAPKIPSVWQRRR